MAAIKTLCMFYTIFSLLSSLHRAAQVQSVSNTHRNHHFGVLEAKNPKPTCVVNFKFGSYINYKRTGNVSHCRITFPITKSMKHGLVCLALPSKCFTMDLTIYVDVESNPGPETLDSSFQTNLRSNSQKLRSTTHNSRIIYTRSFLISLRNQHTIDCSLLATLKSCSLLRYRGIRAGRYKARKTFEKILSKWISLYLPTSHFHSTKPNLNNLVRIPSATYHSSKFPRVRFSTWNACSMNNKIPAICDLIISNHLDILSITETWLTGNDSPALADLTNTLRDYNIYQIPRVGRKGGGTAVIIRKGFTVKVCETNKFSSFESLDLTISLGNKSLRLFTVYRPPPSKRNKLTANMFHQEFSTCLEELITTTHDLIIAGDFNLHVDDILNVDGQKFLDSLDSSGFKQHVTCSTHRKGHTLDLVITRHDDNLVSNFKTITEAPSDHQPVLCTIDLPRPQSSKLKISFRKTQSIDIETFKHDITASNHFSTEYDTDNLDLTINNYNQTLRDLLDNHAPLISRNISLRPHAPWFSDKLRDAKREKRRCERKFLSTRLTIDKQIYQKKSQEYYSLIGQAKADHFKQKIDRSDSKKLFQLVNDLSHVKTAPILPQHESLQILAEKFSQYFESKILTIRQDLSAAIVPKSTLPLTPAASSSTLCSFNPVTSDIIEKTITSSSSKSCQLDPLPTWILKNCLYTLLPFITKIINASLHQGVVPSVFKMAYVRPVIKKSSLNKEDLKNYRPLSNLSFLSKTLEKIVASQTSSYLTDNNLYGKLQSAYRKHHSTETALLRVFNDATRAIDCQNEMLLVLLDLSSAFDTIDHRILLHRLHTRYGFEGTVLNWFKDYLNDRAQSVTLGDIYSQPRRCNYGVPQGSVLGPLLFSLYIAPWEDIINHHDLHAMMFADDSQLYIIMNQSSRDSSLHNLHSCVNDIMSWNSVNMLKSNPDKTEIIHLTSRFRPSIDSPLVQIGDHKIKPTKEARDLGVILDSHLTLKSHINTICRSASKSICDIGKVRKFLSQSHTERLVHAFISSKLDYCNGLLTGLPSSEITKLQRIQNTAARIVVRAKKSEHITPILKKLHWLPIHQRIIFKLLITTYKSLHGSSPTYITELLHIYNPGRSLRSTTLNNLQVPKTNTTTYGDRSFCAIAPKLWNSLPQSIKQSETLSSFKTALKTHLFKQAFLE